MFYTHQSLDRADHLRRDAQAIAALRASAEARLLPVWRGTVLVASPATDAHGKGVPTCAASVSAMETHDDIFLGLVDGTPWFAWSVSELDDDARRALAQQATTQDGAPVAAEFADLRVAGPHVPSDEGALLAYARGMVWWQEQARYCSICGEPLHSKQAGHVRECDNGHAHFPRTDPAVIMLVWQRNENGLEQALLGHNANWPEGTYSTLAGFVEPGESLEQAVTREVREEANIETTNVHYVTSQPWPFPRSIMLGFEAQATTSTIRCEPTELADARWFTRDELSRFGNWGDASPGFKLPRRDSIARFLIEQWIRRGD